MLISPRYLLFFLFLHFLVHVRARYRGIIYLEENASGELSSHGREEEADRNFSIGL